MNIIAYLKPQCGWSNGVRAILGKYGLEYEDKDVINNPEVYEEMVEKSKQELSPCVEIDGKMLADVSGDEVEEYLIKNNLVKNIDKELDVETDSACDPEMHEEKVSVEEIS